MLYTSIKNMTISWRLKILMDSGRSVFRPQDLRVLWKDNTLTAKVNALRMVERGLMFRIGRGYYALQKDFDIYELANAIISPSYVSFNSALFRAGVNFQQKGSVDSVALLSYRKSAEGVRYAYYAMKEDLFFRQEGVKSLGNTAFACPERAILDSFYFGFIPDVDDPDKLDRVYLKELSRLYPLTVQKKARRFYDT
jgi:predicted transcriptional regulator of viral defense system